MLRSLMTVARLDCCVTVVDASSFFSELHSVEKLVDRWDACCMGIQAAVV